MHRSRTMDARTRASAVLPGAANWRIAVLWCMLPTLMMGITTLVPQTFASGRPLESVHRLAYGHFPLWKDVPVRHFAVLGQGMVRGTRWAVFAFRGAVDKNASAKPCLAVAKISAKGLYGHTAGCGPLAPSRGLSSPPMYGLLGGTGAIYPSGRTVGEAFIGMTVAMEVVKVRLELEPGPDITRQTDYLTRSQGKRTHLQRFRYLVLGLPRDVCIRNVTGFNALGNVILNADTDECTSFRS
jgi:hypothetical protein